MERPQQFESEDKTVQHQSSPGLAVSGFDPGNPGAPSETQSAANTSGPLQQLKAMQAGANSSPRVSQLKSLQTNVNQAPVQRQVAPGSQPVQMMWAGSDLWPEELKFLFQNDPLAALIQLAIHEGLGSQAAQINTLHVRAQEFPESILIANQTINLALADSDSLFTTLQVIQEVEERAIKPFVPQDDIEASLVNVTGDPDMSDHGDTGANAQEHYIDPATDIHPDQIDPVTLKAIMASWIVEKQQLCPPGEIFERRFNIWYGMNRPITRQLFRSIFSGAYEQQATGASMYKQAPDANAIQLKRTPNTISTQAQYTGKNNFTYLNVSYMRDGNGNIDFTTPFGKYGAWQNPQKPGSKVNLNQGSKQHRWGIMSSGKKVEIAKASRSQHFAIGDRLLPGNGRGGTWTWHHLSAEYEMVLVDMTVHAKHGHNGGVFLWK